jgi:hypothetical protein
VENLIKELPELCEIELTITSQGNTGYWKHRFTLVKDSPFRRLLEAQEAFEACYAHYKDSQNG